ncbi:hypothetical protein BP6252_00011 [Coleophoma cylindrospora]|uniref:Uncharacterized protein n=1 Tax=Coleophoma cylindrospora TaxID=1849047 RepID=A0A3D8SNR8_9HELO|nr:hypothetical protein BP6252_00011 [Coleophoma cylindrospora]
MEIPIKKLVSNVGQTESLVGAVVLVATIYLLHSLLFRGHDMSHIPLAGEALGSRSKRLAEYSSRTGKSKAMFREEYSKNKSVWRVQTLDGDHVQIPPQFLDDIKGRKDDEVNNLAALDVLVQKKYTQLDSTSDMMNHLVKSDLTTSLNRINPLLGIAAEEAVASEMPACEDWTAINVNDVLVRIIAIVSGYIFIGPELCRDEEYISLSTGYTTDAFTCVFILAAIPPWMRHAAKWVIPHYYRIGSYQRRVRKFLGPVIRERRAAMLKPDYQAPDDLLQWTMNKAHKWSEIRSDDDISQMQLRLSLAAIHTTSTTSTALLYDLVTIPGLIEALRAEIEDVMANYDGVLSNKALYDMKLLDSVMKESQRMNPLGLTGFPRMTMDKGITLPDGTYVPPHTYMEAPIEAIHRDPKIYENADTFDPYRFYNMRKKDEDSGKHQFVTLGTGVLSFGIGRHACPGRFFAANEIKLIMINLIRNFDIEQKEKGPRYANLSSTIVNSADPSRELLFKRVRT